MDYWQGNANEKVFNAYFGFFTNDILNFWEFSDLVIFCSVKFCK